MRILALVGISGVGKSTLLRKLGKNSKFCHLQASELIKAELVRLEQISPSSEDLRRGDIIRNQELMVDGFNRAKVGVEVPIILDAHTIIDGKDNYIDVPLYVFERIGVSMLFFLQDQPGSIVRRRLEDKRPRPVRSDTDLERLQDHSICAGAQIARQLRIPMTLITHYNSDILAAALAPV